MRRTALVLAGSLFILLSGAPLASANTTTLSFDISYSLKPFSFYCAPYKDSFEADKHYLPTGPCTFSVPATVGGSLHAIAVYKGVPGNATGVGGDQFAFSSPTLIREDSMSFGTPAQDQDYFGVIFGGTSQAEITQFDASFRTGSSTGILPPSNNYRLIRWKWGSTPASEYDPVIIIPGILGSWEKNGTWVVDPILHTYDNLIDTFLANGYVENQTLFRFGYDWEEPNEVSAHLLAGKIDQIKQTCGCKKVDVIAHSMGGLVALYYAENSEYKNDIDQLFLVATPILGAPGAYKAWEDGQIDFGNDLQNAFMQTKFLLEARKNGYTDVYDYIHNKPIESVHELLPVTQDYLYDSTYSPLPTPTNGFLEGILQNLGVARTLRLEQILADNALNNTPWGFVVKPTTQPGKWEHGEPIQTLFDAGDGTVPAWDYPIGDPIKQFNDVDHNQVASTSTSYIFKELNNKEPNVIIGKIYNPVTSYLHFKLFSPLNMQIISPDGKRLGKDFSNNTELNEIPGAFYSGFNSNDEYAVITNPLPGAYTVKTVGTGSGTYTIAASYGDTSTTTETFVTGTTTLSQSIDYKVNLSGIMVSITKDIPAPTSNPGTCPVEIAKDYKDDGALKKTIRDGLKSDCKALKTQSQTRDTTGKIEVGRGQEQ